MGAVGEVELVRASVVADFADKTLVELSGPILRGVFRHGTGMRGGRECYI